MVAFCVRMLTCTPIRKLERCSGFDMFFQYTNWQVEMLFIIYKLLFHLKKQSVNF